MSRLQDHHIVRSSPTRLTNYSAVVITLFALAPVQTTVIYIMIEPLREKVSHFLENNELSQNVKTHWDSYSKFFQTAFLIVSLAFGICSAKRDCPKIYHDNGSLSRYLTSPEQCAWPIIANIINGIDLLCKCYKFCTW